MRAFLAALAVVLAAALTPVGLLTSWVHDDVDDTDAYVAEVAPLAADADVRAAVVDAVTAATVAALQEKVPVGLPDQVDSLVSDVATKVVESDRFPQLWREANRTTHEEFRRVVHGDDSVSDGSVEVHLGGVVDLVEDELGDQGLPVELLPDLDPSIALAADKTLGERRALYQRADSLGWWPLVAAAALALLAVAVGSGWRGRLRTAGAAALLAGAASALLLVAVPVAVDQGADAAAPENRDLVHAIAGALTDPLHTHAQWVAVVGVVLGLLLLVGSALPGRRSAAPAP